MRSIFPPALLAVAALGCASATRPQLAATWCANEDDRTCGQRHAALFDQLDLLGPDDGNRQQLHDWFDYRCALDPSSKEAADGFNEQGLDCWRAGELSIALGKLALAREQETRGCEEFNWPEACSLAAEFAHEKIDLVLSHELDCRGKKAAEERSQDVSRYVNLDCDLGSDSKRALKAAEMAKLGRPGPPPSILQCALHGCRFPDRVVKPWATSDW